MAHLRFDLLRRWPDVEAPNLFASDASDRLLLDEASEALTAVATAEAENAPLGADARSVVVIGDRYGALTLGAAAAHGLRGIRVHQDTVAGERALAANADTLGLANSYESLPLDAALVSGARVVLMQLPRSLAELDEIADTIARYAADDVVVFAGGRIKHLTHAMNDVLARSFTLVTATLARQKSRVLVARGVRRPTDAPRYPVLDDNAELGLTVAAHGGAFSGTTLDMGTRFLLSFLGDVIRAEPRARTAIDLGCGTGILAARLAQLDQGLTIYAIDTSAAAVASARATMAANGLDARVHVVRESILEGRPDRSADLIVCNPPFHVGSTVHTGVALEMFRQAGRVLSPGGRLITVFNAHLGYQAELRRLVGPTRELGRNPKFVVTESTRRGAAEVDPGEPRR